MKRLLLICCITALALIALSCTPEAALEISVDEIDDGVVIENVGNVDCLVSVSSPGGEQQFKLAIGESLTVMDMLQPIEVSAVSLTDSASES